MSRPATAMKLKQVSSRPVQNDARPLRSIALTLALCALALVAYLALHTVRSHGELSDAQIGRMLHDDSNPDQVVSALQQISEGRARKQPVAQWDAELPRLAGSRYEEVRAEAVRLMGQDTSHPEFQSALFSKLRDPSLLVRNAAALGLANFGDATGHEHIMNMLQSVAVDAPVSGRIESAVSTGADVRPPSVIATLRNADARTEVHSPVSGRVRRMLVQEGDVVSAGIHLAIIDPGADQVVAALRALELIGYPEDLSALTPYNRADAPAAVREQAAATEKAIRERSAKH